MAATIQREAVSSPKKARMALTAAFFSGMPVTETVATTMSLDAAADEVWRCMLMYEEVDPPPLLLRLLLPMPIASQGDKSRVGAAVRCRYEEGDLTKRITTVEPPRLLEFDVVSQRLGFEGCIIALGGAYRITPCATHCDIELVTRYHAYLRPRVLWRPIEHWIAHRFHRHILAGMRDALAASKASLPA